MESTIKFGLVGCGSISDKHVAALGRLPDAEIVGAFDKSPAAAEAFADRHGIETFTDLGRLEKEKHPDVYDILTPSGIHAESIMSVLPFAKSVVAEKPLALRLDQVDAILEECDRRRVRLFVVQQNRFNLPIRKLKEALDKRRFGKLVLGTVRVRWCRDQAYYDEKPWRGTWALDGGVLTNQASHHIDMLIWLMGDVESVMAKTAARLARIEAEDTGVAILKFRNGALGVIEATTATRPKDLEGSISVLGERGSVEIGGFFMNELKVWNFAEPDEMDADIWEKYSKVPSDKAWNHTQFFTDVMDCIRTGRKGLIDGFEGRKSVELIMALYESAETDREVPLRFSPRKCRLGVASDS